MIINTKDILIKISLELNQSGSPTPEIDAKVLIKYVLNRSEEFLMAHSYEPLTNSEYTKFRRVVRKRKKGEPIAYITKEKEFYGYSFSINKNVLIPRPESELLVENAIKFIKLKVHKIEKGDGLSIIDIGTGSGNIIISLALETNKLRSYGLIPNFYASDISKKALYVARKNVKKQKINDQIKFFYSDLFSNIKMPKKYDLILANLPYVPKSHSELVEGSGELSNSKWINPLLYEPHDAIFTDDNGTKIIKKFIYQVKSMINKNGLILIEADPRNINDISICAKKRFKNSKIEKINDLAGLKRVVKICAG